MSNKTLDEILEENGRLLDQFAEHLTKKGIGQKTVDRHRANVDLYINGYLTDDYTVREASEGAGKLYIYFDEWFNHMAPWTSKGIIQANVASIKKFYRFLMEMELIDEDDWIYMLEDIKDWMEEWQETAERKKREYMDSFKQSLVNSGGINEEEIINDLIKVLMNNNGD